MGEFLRKLYQRFIRIQVTPREISLGLALGLFVGFSPTMGVQIAIAVFLASLFKWNKFAAAIGVQVTNPLTAPVIYGFTYWIGAMLIGLEKPLKVTFGIDWHHIVAMIEQAPQIFLALTIGGVIVGLPAAVVGYLACHAAVQRYQDNLKAKLAQQKDRLKQRMIRRKAAAKKKRTPGR